MGRTFLALKVGHRVGTLLVDRGGVGFPAEPGPTEKYPEATSTYGRCAPVCVTHQLANTFADRWVQQKPRPPWQYRPSDVSFFKADRMRCSGLVGPVGAEGGNQGAPLVLLCLGCRVRLKVGPWKPYLGRLIHLTPTPGKERYSLLPSI